MEPRQKTGSKREEQLMVPKTTSNGFQKCLPRDEKNDCICQLTHTTPATGRPKRRGSQEFIVGKVPPLAKTEKTKTGRQKKKEMMVPLFFDTKTVNYHS